MITELKCQSGDALTGDGQGMCGRTAVERVELKTNGEVLRGALADWRGDHLRG